MGVESTSGMGAFLVSFRSPNRPSTGAIVGCSTSAADRSRTCHTILYIEDNVSNLRRSSVSSITGLR